MKTLPLIALALFASVSFAQAGYCDLNGEKIEGAITFKQCRSLYKDQINGVRVHGKWRGRK